MKIFANGMICLSWLVWALAAPGWSQSAATDVAATAPPAETASDAGAGAPSQEPQQQPPAPAGQAPGQTGPVIQAPPELPKYPDVRMPGESGWWIGVNAWVPKQHLTFDKGTAVNYTQSSLVTMAGTPKEAFGAEVGLAIGLHNALRFSGFETRAAGTFTAGQNLILSGTNYTSGWLLSSDYLLRNYKISFDYLTWPYPVESRRFRLKTLWQIQYVSLRTGFDAPTQPLFDSSGNVLVDSSGNPISYAAQQTHWFITPTLGVGISEYLSPHLRLDVNATGFFIPQHHTIVDSDASVNFRISQFEIGAGAKLFHFKTSTHADYYMKGTLASAQVSIRWYSK